MVRTKRFPLPEHELATADDLTRLAALEVGLLGQEHAEGGGEADLLGRAVSFDAFEDMLMGQSLCVHGYCRSGRRGVQVKPKEDKDLPPEEQAARKRARALQTRLSTREGPRALKDW